MHHGVRSGSTCFITQMFPHRVDLRFSTQYLHGAFWRLITPRFCEIAHLSSRVPTHMTGRNQNPALQSMSLKVGIISHLFCRGHRHTCLRQRISRYILDQSRSSNSHVSICFLCRWSDTAESLPQWERNSHTEQPSGERSYPSHSILTLGFRVLILLWAWLCVTNVF